MAKASTGEDLQPSLLDRLSDDGRFLERATAAYSGTVLTAAGVTEAQVRDALERAGIRHVGQDGKLEVFETTEASRRWREVSLVPIAAGRSADTRTIGDFIDVRRLVRIPFEGTARPARIGMKEIRASVVRNVGWLLNSLQLLDEEGDILPEVRASVLNYGIPALTGLTPGSVDPGELAGQIRLAIERFEPRLREVEVRILDSREDDNAGGLSFSIHGRCWGPDVPERLDLKTTLLLESGRFDVRRDGR